MMTMPRTVLEEKTAPTALVDRFGRAATSLRLSVTDRCNLRCVYCMPEKDIVWLERSGILSFEEIARVTRVLAGAGVNEVRLTGGEPLLRRDLPVLVRMLAAIPGIRDLSVTTNGLLLAGQAQPLVEAGVTRFNVHLDSLDRETFRRAGRRDGLAQALEGIAAVERLGLLPVKVNVVLIRGVNEQEIPAFVEAARTRPWQVRFIEMMPLGEGERHERERLIPGAEVRRRIEAIHPLVAVGRERSSAPASLFRFADGRGEVAFINSVTEPFCADCDRVRLTADGMIRNCLFSRGERDLRPVLRGGGSDADLLAAVRGEVAAKGPGGSLEMTEVYDHRLPRKMWQIGG
ncbi:MAG TPA: GTP 3',8-cyclase MoaA [Candidatus Polarisedimenticolia bacterium]|nr:GTP 3',8-cyclase MoaA [Candidatus Polarisedimenticolia bacterium]